MALKTTTTEKEVTSTKEENLLSKYSTDLSAYLSKDDSTLKNGEDEASRELDETTVAEPETLDTTDGDAISVSIDDVNPFFGEDIEGTDQGETLTGTNGSDTIFGYGGNDTLIGRGGEDSLDGGEGTDWVDYSSATAGVSASLSRVIMQGDQIASVIDGVGYATVGETFTDRLVNIENIRGSEFNDFLRGGNIANVIEGNMGHDIIEGLGGDDHLYGDGGEDTITGGEGRDYIDGGADYDIASYADSDEGVIIHMTGESFGGTAEGDTLVNIEEVVGSDHNDVFYGTGDSPVQNQDNVFRGEAGDDTFIGDAGADTYNGGADTDTVDYRGSKGSVEVHLDTGTGQGGDAEGDTYQSIEDIHGSMAAHNNLWGSTDANEISSYGEYDRVYGLDGDDTINLYNFFQAADGGADDDVFNVYGFGGPSPQDGYKLAAGEIWGGSGFDTVTFNLDIPEDFLGDVNEYGNEDAVYVNLDEFYYVFRGYDLENFEATYDHLEASSGTIFSVEKVVGTDYEDTLIGRTGEDDELVGGAGVDTLNGLSGHDTLTGGADRDYFMFDKSFVEGLNSATITDFGDGNDVVHLRDVSRFSSVDEVLDRLFQEGDDVILGIDGSEIRFENVSLSIFDESDFYV